MKRVQPRAMGRAFFIKHRTSHLTIAVSDETNGGRPPLTRPRHLRGRRPAPASAPAAPAAPPRAARPSRRRGRTQPPEKE
jgi:hypothetical protein